MAEIATWFSTEMFNGVAKLASLSLGDKPRTPDSEKAVADNFAEVLWSGIKWEVHRDTPRIREGFRRLMVGERDVGTERESSFASRKFPQPKDLKAALPRAIISEDRRLENKSGEKSELVHASKSKAVSKILKFMRGLAPTGSEPFNPNGTKLEKVNWLRRRMGKETFANQADWDAYQDEMKGKPEKKHG